MPFNYFCYGAALSEVELDTLTGDFHLLRTDLCMDVGQSLNPAIDIGQVQAFPVICQLQGLCCNQQGDLGNTGFKLLYGVMLCSADCCTGCA